MEQRDRESSVDSDPQGLFFDDDDSLFGDDEHTGPLPEVQRVSRSERRMLSGQHTSRRRNRRVVALMAALLVAILAAAVYLVVLPVYHYLSPSDYDGSGSGSVVVEVQANDGAQDIARTLHDKHVVASTRAFVDAAKDNARSQSIQPGSYRLHEHMSAKSALAMLLDPSSRVNSDVAVPEGATTLDVVKRLTAKPCGPNPPRGTLCGPGFDKAAVARAMAAVGDLGLPTDYLVGGRTPASIEGFLYPATYYFAADADPADALGTMISKFTDEARTTHFTEAAKDLNITPYQELVIASIAQAEAKFPDDYPKVARVILNRIAANRPLQIDATSAYACKLAGKDPATCTYASTDGPYNTYRNAGLPPTPIGNPGSEAMDGAAHPADGNWLYYVNADAAGHLFFTNSESAFVKAAAKCKANNWGCG